MKVSSTPRRPLTSKGPEGTLTGGTAGPAPVKSEILAAVFGAPGTSELVAALDTALAALCTMFGVALRPDAKGARDDLDEAYETLITSVEAFRETVPKA